MVVKEAKLTQYPDLDADFLAVPKDLDLTEQRLVLPSHRDLPYAGIIGDDLYAVTDEHSEADANNLLELPVSDQVDPPRPEAELISRAYQRVTGHEILDDPDASFRPDGVVDEENFFTYFVYSCMHNALFNLRHKFELEGPGIYHLSLRLATYAQAQAPNRGLGPLTDGRWWIAPDAYDISVYSNHNPAKSASADGIHRQAEKFGGEMVQPGMYPSFGLDRPGDEAKFDAALFTFHRVCLERYYYLGQAPQYQEHTEKHWALIVRHKESKTGLYFDSVLDGLGRDARRERANEVCHPFNDWLQRCHKDRITELHPIVTAKQQVLNSCGAHVIANTVAMICFGRLGWDKVTAWKPALNARGNQVLGTKLPAEVKMLGDIERSLHSLMGLRIVTEGQLTQQVGIQIFDEAKKEEMANWKPPGKGDKPEPVPPGGSTTKKEEQELAEREEKIQANEARLQEIEQQIQAKEQQLQEREKQIRTKEQQLQEREEQIRAKEERFQPSEAEAELEEWEKRLRARENTLRTGEQQMRNREKQLYKGQDSLQKQEQEYWVKLDSLSDKERRLEEEDKRLKNKGAALATWEAQLRENGHAHHEKKIEIRDEIIRLNKAFEDISEIRRELIEREKILDAWETSLDAAEAATATVRNIAADDENQNDDGEQEGGKADNGNNSNSGKGSDQKLPSEAKAEAETATQFSNILSKPKSSSNPIRESSSTISLKRKLDELVDKEDRDAKKKQTGLNSRQADLWAAIEHREAQQ